MRRWILFNFDWFFKNMHTFFLLLFFDAVLLHFISVLDFLRCFINWPNFFLRFLLTWSFLFHHRDMFHIFLPLLVQLSSFLRGFVQFSNSSQPEYLHNPNSPGCSSRSLTLSNNRINLKTRWWTLIKQSISYHIDIKKKSDSWNEIEIEIEWTKITFSFNVHSNFYHKDTEEYQIDNTNIEILLLTQENSFNIVKNQTDKGKQRDKYLKVNTILTHIYFCTILATRLTSFFSLIS